MADVLAFNLTQAKAHAPRKFKAPDLSTKLKLLGVEVASFGDFFAEVSKFVSVGMEYWCNRDRVFGAGGRASTVRAWCR